MRTIRALLLGLICAVSVGLWGCGEKQDTRKVTIEGPDSKHELKLETTDKD